MHDCRIAAAIACIGLSSCHEPKGQSKRVFTPDVVAEAELLAADRAFARETSDRGVDGWVEAFTEDGVMFPTGQPLAQGKSEVRAVMALLLSDPTTRVEWDPDRAAVAASGDLGYTLGHTTVVKVVPSGGEVVLGRLKYLTVWKRQPSGDWKVAATVGSADPL